jgi:hypothetical protein
VLLCALALRAEAAAPLKVLVIGGPGESYVTQPDAVLAEALSRAFRWDTRYAYFYTKMDEAPAGTRHMGNPDDIQRAAFADILHLLKDWKPDVTLARLPRDDFKAITPEIQNQLVASVQNGMGLVVWPTSHGSNDFKGQAIEKILPGSGFGGDYSGGQLNPNWKWAAHRLNFGLPLDQSTPEVFYTITGKTSDYSATDLVLTGDENSGRIRVRSAGQGRVVMLAHVTGVGLAPALAPVVDEAWQLGELPDDGEIHLRLIQRAALWAAGDKPDERLSINIPPLAASTPAGATQQEIPVQLLNETGKAQAAEAWASLDGGKPFKIGAVPLAPGLSEQRLAVALPPNLHGGWVPLEISLRRDGNVIGSPPATALRYLKVEWPLAVTLTADRRGAARGESITLTAAVKAQEAAPRDKIRIVWTANDYQRRVLAASEQDVTIAPGGEATSVYQWTLPDLDTNHYRYVLRATAMGGDRVLGDATLPVYRAEPFHLNEGIYHGPWTSLAMMPQFAIPTILDLYEDTGMRSVDTNANPYQIYHSEQRNWRGYTETLYGVDLGDWANYTDDEARAKAKSEVAAWLGSNPLRNSGAFPLLSLGEEAPLTVGGAAICDIMDVSKVAPENLAKIRKGYIAFLQRTYGTLEKLNAQWEKKYTSWDEVEMPWKYFNFYYPNIAMPDKGILNVSQAVDQSAYMHDVSQKAFDAHTRAFKEVLPVSRTIISTGNFFGIKEDVPDAGDSGHKFTLDWAFYDDINRIHEQQGRWLVNGTTMAAYWFDFPLSFNPDLTHTRASMFQRAVLNREVERAPVVLHAMQAAPSPEVVVMRPASAYTGEFYALLQNALPAPFFPSQPEVAWQQLLRASGVFPSTTISPQTHLVILPVAVNLSTEQEAQLEAFEQRGGTLLTTCGSAEYNLRGKPYSEYPGAGLKKLLGLQIARGYPTSASLRWTVSDWPQGATPDCGTLFSTGRDTIKGMEPDVKVLGKYSDGAPALLWRKVGAGQILYFNGIYSIPYTLTSADMPFWANMGGRFAKAIVDLAQVKPDLNLLDGDGKPLSSALWNVAGAGTDQPGAGDVRYVRVAGSLDPQQAQIVSKTPVAAARDALWGKVLAVHKVSDKVNGDSWVIPFTRGPQAAHYITLLPYQPARLVLRPEQSPAKAGAMLEMGVQILDADGKLATGRHAVTLRAQLGGQSVSQWREIKGKGTIPLPIAAGDAGTVNVQAIDWTGGLRGFTKITITPSPLAAHLPAPLAPAQRGMAPRQLTDAEVVDSLNRLARIYEAGLGHSANADEVKWRLGYYSFMIDESRQAIVERGLSKSPWNAKTLAAALTHGARWILTGEDLGIDPLQGQKLSPYNRFDELAPVLKAATSVSTVAGSPDQVVYFFPGGGRLLLDRRSFDYWPSESLDASGANNGFARTSIEDYSGSSQEFTDAYTGWWQGLKLRGLIDDKVLPGALMPLPANFALADWWKNGFPIKTRQSVLDAVSQLPLVSEFWQPPSTIDGYQIGKVLFEDDFKKKNEHWSFEGGVWRWSGDQLVQATTQLMVREGSSWGGRAVMKDVADPRAGPILIEANGRVTGSPRYGTFGVGGGYIPGNPSSGLECSTVTTQLRAGSPTNNSWLPAKDVESVVRSWANDFQFVVLLDGTTIKAKVWNPGLQPEPADWQFSGNIPAANLGSALMLNTDSIAHWNNVRVWQLQKP